MLLEYLHGYSKGEQQRLLEQADFLEKYLYRDVDLSDVTHLLEVGCGVGGQTRILLRRFPHLKITAIDISEEQIVAAKALLCKEVEEGRVRFLKSNAEDLSLLGEERFDGAFLCWFLEHIPEPLKVLKEVRSYLKPDSPIWTTEVNNSSFFAKPYSPAILKYLFEMNDWQWEIGGHPFIGVLLGNLFLQAGYKDIDVQFHPFFFDSRRPEKRKEFFKYFFNVLMSVRDSLVRVGRVDSELLFQVKEEIEKVNEDSDSAILYHWARGTAKS